METGAFGVSAWPATHPSASHFRILAEPGAALRRRELRRQLPRLALPTMLLDTKRWFNSAAHADTLLRILFQPSDPCEPAADVPAPIDVDQPSAQPLVTSKQTPNETGHPEQDSGNNSSSNDNINSGPSGKRAGERSQPARTYHAHALVLRGHSAYFDASLGEVWQQQQQQQEQGGGPSFVPSAPGTILDLHLDPGQEDAMDLLLRSMYDHPLPAVTPDTIPLLFQCLNLADRYDVPQCVSAILSALKDAVSAVVLRHVSHIPPSITGRPEFEALLLSTKRYMVDTCGDVPAVIRSEQLRQEFCSLPFTAVLAWAESDELRVQSENCVVYLLNEWVQAAQQVGGQGVNTEQLEQLAQRVRVLHLGPAYQHHILPQLGWFKGCSGMAHLPTLLALKGKDAAGNPVFPAYGVQLCAEWRKFPAQWVAKARQRSWVADAHQVLKWEVGGEQLKDLYDGGLVSSSCALYFNGFMLGMSAETSMAADGTHTLGLYAGVHPVEAGNEGAIPWPDTAAVAFGYATFTIAHGPDGVLSHTLEPTAVLGLHGLGCTAVLSEYVPSMSALLAPYLKHGKLHVQARFTTVDKA